jgi:hypothetical protein
MARSVLPIAVATALFAVLGGCGVIERAQRPAWRAQAENMCLAQKLVHVSAYVKTAPSINGPGICGLEHPFKVTALMEGAVSFNSQQTIGCPMFAALDQWLGEVVQPLAMARFGQNVVALNSMGSMSCRPANNVVGANLSEHSFGNAVDIGGFRLADGRLIVVARDWTRGGEQEKAFLREALGGACNVFTTVLGPGYNALHYNHFHLDLAQHGRSSSGPRRICKPHPGPQIAPAPRLDNLPDAPDIETDEDLEVAHNRQPAAPGRALAMGSLDAAVPQAFIATAPRQRAMRPDELSPPAPIGMTRRSGPAALPRASATMRSDGVFVPEGDPAEWDATSSIVRR